MTIAVKDSHTGDIAHEDHVHEHPSDKKYVVIALILAAITAFEISLYYLEGSLKDFTAPLLLAGSALKFFLVTAFFMHLKFDNPLLRRIFITGLVLSVCIYLAVLTSMGAVFGRPRQPRPTIDAIPPALVIPASPAK